ncbi:hypothetical protein ABTL39_19650, partial [Acinetobacter baumannii]
ERTRPVVKGKKADGLSNKQRKGINRRREQQPAEHTEPGEIENDTDREHGGSSCHKSARHVKVCAFHHHHGAT